MTNEPIDLYSIELEMLGDDENAASPVRCIATSTYDKTTADAWLNIGQTRSLIRFACGGLEDHVDSWMHQLQDHHYVDLVAQYNEGKSPDRCMFNSHEILPFGFVREELHPWKPEML